MIRVEFKHPPIDIGTYRAKQIVRNGVDNADETDALV